MAPIQEKNESMLPHENQALQDWHNSASTQNPDSGSRERAYRNPWTSISRPMNRFMDIDEAEWQT
jgi:hypothetical protein